MGRIPGIPSGFVAVITDQLPDSQCTVDYDIIIVTAIIELIKLASL